MHKFNQKNMGKLDNPRRRLEMPPERTLELLGLTEGNTVADIGCGTGYFTIPAAEIIGETSLIYALDTSEEMLTELKKRAEEAKAKNIIIVQSMKYFLIIGKHSVDFSIMSNVLHEVEDKDKMIGEITRILKHGAIFALIEWEKKQGETGPPEEDRISFDETVEMLSKNGYEDINRHYISENFYGLTARKC